MLDMKKTIIVQRALIICLLSISILMAFYGYKQQLELIRKEKEKQELICVIEDLKSWSADNDR